MSGLPRPNESTSPPEVPLQAFTTHAPNVEATLELGRRVARCLAPGMSVALIGDLGSGKTTMVRGVLAGLGWAGAVKSPTYTLVEHYQISSIYFYHFDFYRIEDPDEFATGGFADYFSSSAVCFVEWPERVAPWLPAPDLEIRLRYAAEDPAAGRDIELAARTEQGRRCVSVIADPGG